jgi:hypothetical protein
MNETESEPLDRNAMEQARHGLEQVEAGNPKGAKQTDKAQRTNPASTEAAEQEASEGPAGLGLSR